MHTYILILFAGRFGRWVTRCSCSPLYYNAYIHIDSVCRSFWSAGDEMFMPIDSVCMSFWSVGDEMFMQSFVL